MRRSLLDPRRRDSRPAGSRRRTRRRWRRHRQDDGGPDRGAPADGGRNVAGVDAGACAGAGAGGDVVAGLVLSALLLVAAPALLLAPEPAAAQQRPGAGPASEFHASPYLPLGHWAYDILDHWIHTGRVESLSPLTRPWRRMDVARAVRRVARGRPHAFEEGWLERLREEFRRELAVLEGRAEGEAGYLRTSFEAGARYMSQTHRDPLRPELEGRFSADRVLDIGMLKGDGRVGPVVGGLEIGRDRLFVNDAQFPDGRVVEQNDFLLYNEQAIRPEEGYLEVQGEHASLFFGRMYRNWGLPGMDGFVRSDYAYSYEELGYRVGTERVFLIGTATSLGDAGGDTTRYFTTHRVEVRPADELVLSLSEGAIHGGPDRPLDLALVNPLSVWQPLTDVQLNAVGQLDVWWRPVRGLAVYGSANLDATNSLGSSKEIDSCCQMGGSLGVELPGAVRAWSFRARATALQSLVYRTRRPWEEWSVRGIGLGWDKVDLYLATLEAEWLGRPGLVLRPRVDLQVKGEGTFRGRLRPPSEQLPDFPNILVGQAETTLRPALAGRWRPGALGGGWSLDLSWDLGVSFLRDFGNVEGDDRTAFVGEVKAMLSTPDLLVPLD